MPFGTNCYHYWIRYFSEICIACLVVLVALIAGVNCLFFAYQRRKRNEERASDIISQINLIEKRYQNEME